MSSLVFTENIPLHSKSHGPDRGQRVSRSIAGEEGLPRRVVELRLLETCAILGKLYFQN